MKKINTVGYGPKNLSHPERSEGSLTRKTYRYEILHFVQKDARSCAGGSWIAGSLLFGIFTFFIMIPTSFAATIISVPFTSQAPAGNWAEPWQDFCEEASVVMSAHFLWNAPLTSSLAETEMQLIKQYEELVFKKYNDTSAAETASILKNLYGFKNIETRHIDSVSDITKELSQAHIVLVPAAGRLLHNPYFIAPGPLYHMVLIRGFDDVKHTFIVNDPGTRRGNGFVYNQDLLFRAIHDWNGGDVMRGEKNVIIVKQ